MEDSELIPRTLDPGGLTNDNVPVGVSGGKVGGVQLCPALILNSQHAIPPAVKHMYSKLAASAYELDQGIADLQIVLCAHGNSLSKSFLEKIENSLARIVSRCGVWIISSGEHADPLATAASNVIRTTLPQLESEAEVLHLCVNRHSMVCGTSAPRSSGVPEVPDPMVNAAVNTLLALAKNVEDPKDVADFRAHFAVRLAHPPPALLIGVPNDVNLPSGLTPLNSSSPPILLSPSNDSRPLPVVIYAGQSVVSLHELLVYVQNGFPVIVLQDSCELCDILYNAWILYRSAKFEYSRFMEWLSDALSHTVDEDEESGEGSADVICQIFSIAFSDAQLIEFVASDEISSLPSRIIEICSSIHPDPMDTKRALQVAAKLNLPKVLNSIDLDAIIDENYLQDLLVDVLASNESVDFLAALLERNLEFTMNGEFLLRVLNASDQHFFNTIVLCQCMGYSSTLSELDDEFCVRLEELLCRLSHGVHGLFPNSLSTSVSGGIACLTVWTLLLNRTALTTCLLAHSDHPISTALILSRIAKSLSYEAHDWFFYEDSLLSSSRSLSQFALSLLDSVHSKSPSKSYHVLCQPIETMNGTSITQIAFQSHNQHFIAHECCQRWIHRLLYGNLQTRTASFPSILPKWMKLVLSAFLVVPIRSWVAVRPSSPSTHRDKRCTSPTVALLEAGRTPKKIRAFSTFSMVSGRSDAFTNITSPLVPQSAPAGQMMTTSMQNLHQMHNGQDSVTPQSMILPLQIDDTDGNPVRSHHKKRRHKTRWIPPSMSVFYSTPIVKYWVSLVFRLLFLGTFAYSILLPGCGSTALDTLVWAWSLMSWIENVYVLWFRSQSLPIKQMPWRVFDVGVTFAFLLGMLTMKLFGDQLRNEFFPLQSVYWARVLTAFFLLYSCYSTLFMYIPLSDLFGPMMVRIKLMVVRDFTNFLILVALIMISSAVAVHAILYPDQPLSLPVIRKSLSWAWLSIFTTDMSGLQESDRCKKSFLGSPREYCLSVGEHSDFTCPKQGWAGYVAVIEYFILLKLICWPILFAFFAKTAKSVEEEADKIWKYQMYGLIVEMSIRPCVPPPFTPLYFLFSACCRPGSFMCCVSQTMSDHPDMTDGGSDRPDRKHSLFRNPSIPFKKYDFINAFWRQTAIAKWWESRNGKKNEVNEVLSEVRHMKAHLRMMGLNAVFERNGSGKSKKSKRVRYLSTSAWRHELSPEEIPWTLLIPGYDPPFYSKPVEEFPVEVQRYVDVTTKQNVTELRRLWRARQAQDFMTSPLTQYTLSAAAFPLNPNGRTGIAGRGVHARFGANHKCFYIIISNTQLLFNASGELPHEWRYETGSRDEHLTAILVNIGIPEGEAQVLSTRRLESGVSDTGPAQICLSHAPSEEDTDHAWSEHDVWAVCLRSRRVSSTPSPWKWTSLSTSTLPLEQRTWVQSARDKFGV